MLELKELVLYFFYQSRHVSQIPMSHHGFIIIIGDKLLDMFQYDVEVSLIRAKTSSGAFERFLICSKVFLKPSTAPMTEMMLATIDNGSAIPEIAHGGSTTSTPKNNEHGMRISLEERNRTLRLCLKEMTPLHHY